MVNNECPTNIEEDLKDYRFSHLYSPPPENYNLNIKFPSHVWLGKTESIDFLKKEGIL
jgi:hypothetical protein